MLSKDVLEMEAATKQKKGRCCFLESTACPKHSWDGAVEKEGYREGMDNGPVPVMGWEESFSPVRLDFFTTSIP